MNRSVMNRQMFAKGGPVRYMQQGGVAAPMPMAAPAPAPMPMAAPAPAPMPMAPPAMAAPPPVDPMAAAQEAINPAELEGMLAQASQTIGDLDQAGSYEEVMNMMRGDEASVQERRSELAGLVGPEDAQQTPESVLTLVQPVIQMASVDQGIGGLAQEQMSAPVEGDMAGGIMSTVGMGAPEGPPPVNFNQGGVVRRPGPFPDAMLPDFTSVMEARPSGQILSIPRPPGYTPETPMYLRPSERFRFEDLDQPIPEAIRGMPRDYRSDPISADASSYEQETLGEGGAQLPDTQAAMEGMDPSSESAELAADTVDPLDSLMSELGYGDERSLDEYFQESRDLYRGLISEADREASRSDVREAAKTQFLSDLGKAGLLLASPTASPMSFFEKLSGAVSGSEMFDNLARQAAAISEAERGFRDQDLKLDLAALTDAQKRSLADQEARRALQLRMLEEEKDASGIYTVLGPDGESYSGFFTDSQLQEIQRLGNYQVFEGGEYDPDGEAGSEGFVAVRYPDGSVRTIPESGLAAAVGAGATQVTTPSSEQPMVQPILFIKNNQKMVFNTLDDGKTVRVRDPGTGEITNIPMSDAVDMFGQAVEITCDDAAQIAASFARESELNQQLAYFEQTGEFASPGFNPLSTGQGDMDLSYATSSAEELAPGSGLLEEAAQKSGGVAAAIRSSASTLSGALGAGEIYPETTEAKKDLEFFMVLARAALVTNPRYPVTELEQVSRLFPNPREMFSSPPEGVRTIRRIKKALLKLKYDTLVEQRNLAGSGRSSPTREAQLAESMRHVNLALSMVQDVDLSREPNFARNMGTTSFADFVLSDPNEFDRVNAGREGVE